MGDRKTAWQGFSLFPFFIGGENGNAPNDIGQYGSDDMGHQHRLEKWGMGIFAIGHQTPRTSCHSNLNLQNEHGNHTGPKEALLNFNMGGIVLFLDEGDGIK